MLDAFINSTCACVFLEEFKIVSWSRDTDLAVGVDVDALVVVAEQQLHPVGIRQRHDCVRDDGALRVLRDVDVVDTTKYNKI